MPSTIWWLRSTKRLTARSLDSEPEISPWRTCGCRRNRLSAAELRHHIGDNLLELFASRELTAGYAALESRLGVIGKAEHEICCPLLGEGADEIRRRVS